MNELVEAFIPTKTNTGTFMKFLIAFMYTPYGLAV